VSARITRIIEKSRRAIGEIGRTRNREECQRGEKESRDTLLSRRIIINYTSVAFSFLLLLRIAERIASQRNNFTSAISVAAPLRVLLSQAWRLIHCGHVLDAEIAEDRKRNHDSYSGTRHAIQWARAYLSSRRAMISTQPPSLGRLGR